MNDETTKLAKIKKSCHAGKIVARILFIIAVVGTIAAIAGGTIILSMGKDFDRMINDAAEQGYIDKDKDYIGSSRLFGISIGSPDNIESDVPAIKKIIEEQPYSFMFGLYMLIIGFVVAVTAVMLKLVESVFALIEKEETPFSDKVRRRVTIVLAVASGMLLMTTSAGIGVLGIMTTWAVYTILDYGKTLQIQSDETL